MSAILYGFCRENGFCICDGANGCDDESVRIKTDFSKPRKQPEFVGATEPSDDPVLKGLFSKKKRIKPEPWMDERVKKLNGK